MHGGGGHLLHLHPQLAEHEAGERLLGLGLGGEGAGVGPVQRAVHRHHRHVLRQLARPQLGHLVLGGGQPPRPQVHLQLGVAGPRPRPVDGSLGVSERAGVG